MTRTGVIALGVAQCVNWGVLYYAFTVLVLPLQRELAAPTWLITGAFSLALLASAVLAPTAGRWADNDRGALMMQAGGTAAAGVLVAWTFVPGIVMLYAVWAGLGLCMATTLYEPAFVIVGRAYSNPAKRLRAMAAITLFGGLASTVFLPLTAFLTDALGWRGAVRLLAASLLLSVGISRVLVFRVAPAAVSALPTVPDPFVAGSRTHPVWFPFVTVTCAFATLASAAFTVNLFPLLDARGLASPTAAIVGGLMGVMQLPGRALLLHGALSVSPGRLLAVCLALHAAGLGAVALAPSVSVVVGGTMVFALGAGLMTVVRPHLVQTLFGARRTGHLNGRIVRHQQLARAAGPFAVAWTASVAGYGFVFLAIAMGFVLAAAAWCGFIGGKGMVSLEKEAV